MLSMLGKVLSRRQIEIIFLFSQKIELDILFWLNVFFKQTTNLHEISNPNLHEVSYPIFLGKIREISSICRLLNGTYDGLFGYMYSLKGEHS